jgi:uncharacterized protein (DUF697 family)
MSNWNDFGNIWNTFKELDTRPIAEQAERAVIIAVAGKVNAGKSTLISALRDGARLGERIIGATIEVDLDESLSETVLSDVNRADLIILVLDAMRNDYAAEMASYDEWKRAGRTVVVFYNKMDLATDPGEIARTLVPWVGARVAFGVAIDVKSLATEFIPRIVDALKERHLSLARHYPLFRLAVARALINDTSFANASYALGTGLAEIVPVLNVPFNVADMLVMTKNQALMAYKLGLAFGLPPRWQEHAVQLSGVVGAGFLWRQAARQLIGLIPVWGIVPKVAIAYAGTYVIGEAIINWYLTGDKLSGKRMREIYAEATKRGREIAKGLVARARTANKPRFSLPTLRLSGAKGICPHCGKRNPRDAKYCAYCATLLG